MTDKIAAHHLVLTLHIDVMDPEHDKRGNPTKWFREARHQMIDVEDQGCWTCGSKEGRELHHFHIERFMAEDIKPHNWAPGSNLRKDFPDFPWDKIESIYEFVDSAANCRVYCKEHHTGKKGSIHFMPHPMQNGMRYMDAEVRDEYLLKHEQKLQEAVNNG